MESVWHDATHSAVLVKMRRIVNIIIIQHRALLSPQAFGDLIFSFHYYNCLEDF